MKKIYIIGNVNCFNKPHGPANVIINLLNNFDKNNIPYIYINSNINTIFVKVFFLFKLFLLLFKKNCVINVHSFGYQIPYLIFLLSKINKSNEYFLTLHGLMSVESRLLVGGGFYGEYTSDQEKYDRMEKQLILHFPNIIVVSNYLKKVIKEKFNRSKHVYTIHNGVNYKAEMIGKIINEDLRAVMAGGIFSVKSIFELLHTIYVLKQKVDIKINLDIYGRYESEESLNNFYKLIQELSLNDCVHYRGTIDNEELLNKYAESHICFCISKFDTFNLTALEAIMNSTPVIISLQCGASELFEDYVNGFIVDMNSDYQTKICKIFDYILANQSKYNEISANAYKLATEYTWDKISQKYINLFRNTVTNKGDLI